MFFGVYIGCYEQVLVQDFGIDNCIVVDGLVVGCLLGFVGCVMQCLFDGYYMVDDDELFCLFVLFECSQGICLEFLVLVGVLGIVWVICELQGYCECMGLILVCLVNVIYLVWVIGGGMVFEMEMCVYLE